MDYTFKKSTCEKYEIRWPGCGWAIITIDEDGGVFNCQSDYGNYSYSWPSHGRKSFKHFLIEVARDPSYLLNKMSDRSYFDFDQSLIAWEKSLQEMLEEGYCTEDQYSEVLEFFKELSEYSMSHIVQMKILENDILNSICDPLYCFSPIIDYPAEAKNFANVLMPIFSEILQKELAA